MAGAAVYASCTPLIPVPVHEKKKLLTKKMAEGGKQKHGQRSLHDGHGKVVLFRKKVKFAVQHNATGIVSNTGIRVEIPPGLHFVKGRNIKLPVSFQWALGYRKVRDTYNASSRVVTWWPLPFDSHRKYVFAIKVRVPKAKLYQKFNFSRSRASSRRSRSTSTRRASPTAFSP